MSMFDNCSIPLLSSERGMILVIALICYTALAIFASTATVVLTTMGGLLLLGFGFYFKDKAAEAVQSTEVAKIEAAK
jgi:hypothetical protein